MMATENIDFPLRDASWIEKLKIFRARLFLLTLGNSLSWKINLIWKLHHIWCWFKSFFGGTLIRSSDAAVGFCATEIHKKGFTKINTLAQVDTLSAWVEDYFKTNPTQKGVGFVSYEEAEKMAPELYKILGPNTPISRVVRQYYGSHYQVYWVHCTRYEPGVVDNDAFTWHADDNPRQILKIFIYLNDTRDENAAFRCFNYSTSRKLFRRGFLSFTPPWRAFSQQFVTDEMVKNELNVFEGPMGTMLVFDNNLVHRATPPREGYRNMVTIEIMPGERCLTLQDIVAGCKRVRDRDYPRNPFKIDG